MTVDWTGREVTEEESPDQVILIWEIDPASDSRYDVTWVRGYQDARKCVEQAVERLMEGTDYRDLLEEGVSVTMRLRVIKLWEYLEIFDE